MFSRKFLLAAILAAIGVCTAPTVSQADFKVRIELYNSTGTTLLNSMDVLDGDNDGSITSNNANLFGKAGLKVNLTASSNRTDPLGNPAQLQDIVATVQNSNSTAYQVRVTVTDTDYTIPAGANPMTLKSTLGASAFGNKPVTGSFQSGVDVTNNEFTFGVTTPVQTVSAAGLGSESVKFNRTGKYSISNEFILNLNSGMTSAASLTGTSEVSAAPAPAGLILLLGAVPFVGLFRRVMKRSTPATEAMAA